MQPDKENKEPVSDATTEQNTCHDKTMKELVADATGAQIVMDHYSKLITLSNTTNESTMAQRIFNTAYATKEKICQIIIERLEDAYA
jgi:hypothetical protein